MSPFPVEKELLPKKLKKSCHGANFVKNGQEKLTVIMFVIIIDVHNEMALK